MLATIVSVEDLLEYKKITKHLPEMPMYYRVAMVLEGCAGFSPSTLETNMDVNVFFGSDIPTISTEQRRGFLEGKKNTHI